MGFTDPPAERPKDTPAEMGGYDRYAEDHELYPSLTELVGACRYKDGSERETGSVLIFCDDGQLKVMFKNAAEDRVGFAVLSSLEALLGDLNHKLESGHVDWRRDKNRRRR